ncbi:hypothetical protein [Alkaliphilus oremlandii]|uniref:Ethanolamine utilization protein n=1 Tax=Alkaliphilus oremlandii (strain OhILAs) TaxID=350688 RepID=A8MEM7_ALKOO|nr:hypothetical protein [Alkaliphilus oremlandii]ABW18356.1 hypothetical protein Clos_0805 [Alkaliphilus oremlandii OhILAs]
MDNIEIFVQKITDILMQRLEKEEPRKTLAFLGKEYTSIRTYYEQKGYRIVSFQEKMDEVIVTELPILNMNRLALGLPQGEDEIIIWDRLLKQKKVMVLQEGMELYISRQNISPALLQVLEHYKKQLVKYGVSILPLKNFEKSRETIHDVKNEAHKGGKKELLTIAKVREMNLQEGDIFEADPNTIITALARDYMRDLGVQIR